MRTILAFALLLAVANAATRDYSFKGNVSWLQTNDDFNFRFSSLTSTGSLATWISASVAAHSTSSGTTGADVDTLVGQIFAGSILNPPWSWLAYIKASFSGTPSSSTFTSNTGALVMAYLTLYEVDPDGKVVKESSLKNGWSLGSVVPWGNDLSVVNMTASVNGAEVVISYITSNILGQLNYANAIVSPKTAECVIEINHWPYVSYLNHLELTMGVATVDASMKGNAIITKKGDGDVYFTLSSDSIVNGTLHDVEISDYVEGDFDTSVMSIWVSVLVGSKAKTRLVTVSFAPGGSTVVYDPAFGQGTLVYGASAGLIPSLLLLCVLLLSLLL